MLKKKLFPSTYLNGVFGRALHFTYILSHQATYVINQLAHEFKISIHFEHDNHLHKVEALALLQKWLATMHINLNNEIITTISVMIYPIYKKVGICKVWFSKPEK